MTYKVSDRVKELTSVTGLDDIVLSGPITGFTSFSSAFTNGDTVYYCIEDASGNYEVGYGTYNSNNLTRETVLFSSNSNNKVNFSSGTKKVFNSITKHLLDNKSDLDEDNLFTGVNKFTQGIKFNDDTVQTTAYTGGAGGLTHVFDNIIDFGNGDSFAEVTINTALANSTKLPIIRLYGTTTDHPDYEDALLEDIRLEVVNINNGVSITVAGYAPNTTFGQYKFVAIL